MMINQINPQAAIKIATSVDAQRCLAVLTLAFNNDPPCRWVWPDPQQYLEAFPRFAQAFGGSAIRLGTAYHHTDYAGVALWLPPGAGPDEKTVIQVIEETVADGQQAAMFSIFEQMDAYHPREPHWHLSLIGVDPACRGRGIGSALLSRVLQMCDDQQVLAYLEATSPQNMALYQRHGFEVLGRIQAADAPPITPMLRTPR